MGKTASEMSHMGISIKDRLLKCSGAIKWRKLSATLQQVGVTEEAK